MIMGAQSLDSLADYLKRAYHRYEKSAQDTPPEPAKGDEEGEPAGDQAAAWAARSPYVPLSPQTELAWQQATRVFVEGEIVRAIVTGWNRGGLLVRWDELQGFVPASQLRDIPVFEDDDSRDEKLARWVGEELTLKVIELDQSRNRLVFSERATMWGPRDGDRLLAEIAPGQVRQGYVSNICDFGAFVDLGGLDGLIHVSELSRGRVNHPREILEIGQQIAVYVISVDPASRRVALSLKRMRPDPWSSVDEKYHSGQLLTATITNIVDFGAFARIEDGLEGLIHISELSDGQVLHPGEVVSPGDEVQVRVLRIDSSSHRLGLSIRQVAAPQMGASEAPPFAQDEQDESSVP